jgi:hypothetical protein
MSTMLLRSAALLVQATEVLATPLREQRWLAGSGKKVPSGFPECASTPLPVDVQS